jgi:hypothetical protein|tara:strand:- start:1990 stop:2775 length:786 start_codon:yes stop_codon:yes gene_type:complete
MSNGFIFHESEDIVCIATGKSSNEKTGDEEQTWILYKHEPPNIAIDTGKDSIICGDCKHRGIVLSLDDATIYSDMLTTPKKKALLKRIEDKRAKGLNSINIDRDCYVLVFQAPLAVYKCWKRGGYPTLTPKQAQKRLAYKVVRLGSYGDPVHIPKWKLDIILKFTLRITGYTHQWKNKKYIEYKQYFMASVDTPKERLLAKSLGYRTFRVEPGTDDLDSNEVGCLSDKKVRGNKKLVPCVDCGMCDGLTGKVTKDIVVRLH